MGNRDMVGIASIGRITVFFLTSSLVVFLHMGSQRDTHDCLVTKLSFNNGMPFARKHTPFVGERVDEKKI